MKTIPRDSAGTMFSAATRSLLLLILVINLASYSAYSQTRRQPIIFAVSAESGDASMDAIGILDGKTLRAPYQDNEKDHQRFGDQYWAAGTVYRLMFGGGEAGTVTVNKWGLGCETLHAQATLNTKVRIGGKVWALATNSESLGKRSPSLRAPSEAERGLHHGIHRRIGGELTSDRAAAHDEHADASYAAAGPRDRQPAQARGADEDPCRRAGRGDSGQPRRVPWRA